MIELTDLDGNDVYISKENILAMREQKSGYGQKEPYTNIYLIGHVISVKQDVDFILNIYNFGMLVYD